MDGVCQPSALICPCYKFLVDESLDGVGLASSGAAEDAIGVGVPVGAAAAGVVAEIGVGVGTKTVGMGEALIGGGAGTTDGDAIGVAVCSNAVPVP
jgi:hypothetical protein